MISLGILFAIVAAVLNAGYAVVSRAAMKKEKDTVAWAVLYQLFAGILFIIPAILFFRMPNFATPFYWMLGASIIWGIYMVLSWASYRAISVSVRQTLNSTKNIFVILFAFLLLQEAITLNKIIGSIIIICGVAVVSFGGWSSNKKGTFLTLGSASSQALARTMDKFAISFFSTPVYAALQYFLPASWVSLTQKNLIKRSKKVLKAVFGWLILAAIIGGMAAFFQFESYRRLDVGTAVLIMELSTVLATIGGIVFLKERERIFQKLLGAAIVTLGVILIIVGF